MAAQTPNAPFDHSATLFRLDGAHARISCESCHRPDRPATGLPRTCNACHIPGGLFAATFQSARHIPSPSTQLCSDCHNQFTWTPASMRHTADMNGQCARCHNNAQAPGKPPSHLATTSSCDVCHTVGVWTPAKKMVHDASTVSRCSTCHDGRIASGKSAAHVSTTAQCDTCHTSTVTWRNAQYVHDPSSFGRCSTCHNYNTARGMGANHIPTTAQCDTCHTSQITFTARTMNHTGLVGQCSTCHGGAYLSQNAQTKPVNHLVTALQCDSSGCHSGTTSWALPTGAVPNHTGLATTSCVTCHTVGGSGTPKGLTLPSTHIPTSPAKSCVDCHNTYPQLFKPIKTMDHTGTNGLCSTCHNGSYTFANAQARNPTHIPDSRSCDACHLNFVAFTPATMNHTGLNGQCATCHGGAYLSENAQMKPANHLVTASQCDSSGCHSGTTSWALPTGTVPNHAVLAPTSCVTCHTVGGSGTPKGLTLPSNHIPTSPAKSCADCHNSYPQLFRPIRTMDHTGTNGQCLTCHNGSYTFAGAARQDVTHIPDTRQCDTCHKIFTAFKPAVMNHTGLAGKCSGCHSGAYVSKNALQKSASHIPDARQCDACHPLTTGPWARPNLSMNHTGLTGQCITCHNGAYLAANAQRQPPAPHVPTSAQCDACHTSTTLWTPVKHITTGIAGQCQVCHTGPPSGVYTLAVGEPVNHVARSTSLLAGASMSCDACHKNTVTWSATMNHNNSLGNGSGWCKNCHATGSIFPGSSQKKSLTHDKSTGVTDCSQSGCHRPLGNRGSTYVKW